jgi:hypothetical protein
VILNRFVIKLGEQHQMHAAKCQGRVFSESSKGPQATQHTRTLLGDPKTDNKLQNVSTINESH